MQGRLSGNLNGEICCRAGRLMLHGEISLAQGESRLAQCRRTHHDNSGAGESGLDVEGKKHHGGYGPKLSKYGNVEASFRAPYLCHAFHPLSNRMGRSVFRSREKSERGDS